MQVVFFIIMLYNKYVEINNNIERLHILPLNNHGSETSLLA